MRHLRLYEEVARADAWSLDHFKTGTVGDHEGPHKITLRGGFTKLKTIFRHGLGYFRKIRESRCLNSRNDPRDGIALNHIKRRWQAFSALLVDLGYCATRTPIPNLKDLKTGFASYLSVRCEDRAQVHGRGYHSVFKGYMLHEKSLEEREREEDTFFPD